MDSLCKYCKFAESCDKEIGEFDEDTCISCYHFSLMAPFSEITKIVEDYVGDHAYNSKGELVCSFKNSKIVRLWYQMGAYRNGLIFSSYNPEDNSQNLYRRNLKELSLFVTQHMDDLTHTKKRAQSLEIHLEALVEYYNLTGTKNSDIDLIESCLKEVRKKRKEFK